MEFDAGTRPFESFEDARKIHLNGSGVIDSWLSAPQVYFAYSESRVNFEQTTMNTFQCWFPARCRNDETQNGHRT